MWRSKVRQQLDNSGSTLAFMRAFRSGLCYCCIIIARNGENRACSQWKRAYLSVAGPGCLSALPLLVSADSSERRKCGRRCGVLPLIEPLAAMTLSALLLPLEEVIELLLAFIVSDTAYAAALAFEANEVLFVVHGKDSRRPSGQGRGLAGFCGRGRRFSQDFGSRRAFSFLECSWRWCRCR